ncbi:MAG: hypothetical protein GX660_05720 [Clostridiaceae bacterium]|nr:hypothetical protein [Clostridiaceae bacterium]
MKIWNLVIEGLLITNSAILVFVGFSTLGGIREWISYTLIILGILGIILAIMNSGMIKAMNQKKQ